MEFNAFALIQEGLGEELAKQGFGAPQPLEDPAGQAVMFSTDEVAYSLVYDEKHQRFQLRSPPWTGRASQRSGGAFLCGFSTRKRAPAPMRRAS